MRRDPGSRSVVRLVGVVVALTVCQSMISGALAAAATTTAQDTLRAAVRATRDAPSFVVTMKRSGYQPPDSGDPGPITLVYQAPDRFSSVQHSSGEPATTYTIQIGHDHYQQDSAHPNVWMHNTLPPVEKGWGSFLSNALDPLLAVKNVTRDGDTYRLSQTAGNATGVAVARVANGHLVSLDVHTNVGAGKTQESKMTFSHFGTAPKVNAPTTNVQEDG
jgi:hypothetical protein